MEKQIKIHEVLSRASLFLRRYHKEESAALLLLEHHLGWDRSKIYANLQEAIPTEVEHALQADLKKHVDTNIPMQHLMGKTEFYGREFIVNGDVLVPRFETEELVAEALRIVHEGKIDIQSVVDLGTGSGVIATSIACEAPEMNVYASDISEEALHVAEENIAMHGADVTTFKGNFAQPFIDKGICVQMVVSNPPYIAYDERETLSETVRDYDPSLALFAEKDGLAAYEIIIKQAENILDDDGVLLFEIGHTQGERVKALIVQSYPTSEVTILQDINGKDRIVRAYV